MKRILPAALVLATACAQGAPYIIDVMPGGSLKAARDAARALPAASRANGVEIVLAPGVSRIGDT